MTAGCHGEKPRSNSSSLTDSPNHTHMTEDNTTNNTPPGGSPAGAEKNQGGGDPSQNDLPHIELPRVGRILSEFARDVGAVMSTNGVFLQDGLPVVLEPKTDRMQPLTPACFRTYAEKNLRTVKPVRVNKIGSDGQPYATTDWQPDSMNKMQAEAVLTSHMFLELQRPLRRISRIPVPILRGGELTLQSAGYDAETKILVKEA